MSTEPTTFFMQRNNVCFFQPAVVKAIYEEADAKTGCPKNPKWLKQGHVKRALHACKRDVYTATNNTPKDCLSLHQIKWSIRSYIAIENMNIKAKYNIYDALTVKTMRSRSMLCFIFQAFKSLSTIKEKIAHWIVPAKL